MSKRGSSERYESTDMSESGGFGNVAKYLDTHLERYVAIKSISHPDEASRMLDELQALMTLRSKHVVQLYDVIENNNNTISIVEEYVDGPSLIDYVENIKNESQLLKILWQISSGISEIHRHDIIHRDIKPANMKIDKEGVVKIYDFGLSRKVNNANTIGFKGTPIYAAPELFLTEDFTKAVDVYAFGVTAMCLSKTPVPSEMSVLPKILTLNPFLSSGIKLHRSLQDILFKCLAVKPGERPSMQLVCDAIKKYVLLNSHRALLIPDNDHPVVLSQGNLTKTFDNPGIGSIEIKYSGSEFYIANVSGEVMVNNIPVNQYNVLPNSCVIILGNISRKRSERVFITFDLSHPEVVL